MKKKILTSGGRLFSVTVVGAPLLLKDSMVAAHTYVMALEDEFPDAATLLACFFARRKELKEGELNLSDGEVRLAARWRKAEAIADRAARPALSNPKRQKFLVKVTEQN